MSRECTVPFVFVFQRPTREAGDDMHAGVLTLRHTRAAEGEVSEALSVHDQQQQEAGERLAWLVSAAFFCSIGFIGSHVCNELVRVTQQLDLEKLEGRRTEESNQAHCESGVAPAIGYASSQLSEK